MPAQVTVPDIADMTGSGAIPFGVFERSGVGREMGVAGPVAVIGGSK
jgi:hypothetical protein